MKERDMRTRVGAFLAASLAGCAMAPPAPTEVRVTVECKCQSATATSTSTGTTTAVGVAPRLAPSLYEAPSLYGVTTPVYSASFPIPGYVPTYSAPMFTMTTTSIGATSVYSAPQIGGWITSDRVETATLTGTSTAPHKGTRK